MSLIVSRRRSSCQTHALQYLLAHTSHDMRASILLKAGTTTHRTGEDEDGPPSYLTTPPSVTRRRTPSAAAGLPLLVQRAPLMLTAAALPAAAAAVPAAAAPAAAGRAAAVAPAAVGVQAAVPLSVVDSGGMYHDARSPGAVTRRLFGDSAQQQGVLKMPLLNISVRASLIPSMHPFFRTNSLPSKLCLLSNVHTWHHGSCVCLQE